MEERNDLRIMDVTIFSAFGIRNSWSTGIHVKKQYLEMNLEARCVYENFSWHRQIWTDHKQGAQHGKYPHTLPHMLAYHTTPHTHKLAPVMNKIFWQKIRLACTLQPSKQFTKRWNRELWIFIWHRQNNKKLQMHVKMGLSQNYTKICYFIHTWFKHGNKISKIWL